MKRVGEREDGKRGCTHSPLLKGDTFNDSGNVVLRRCWYGAGDEIHSRRPYYGSSYRLSPDWFHGHSCQVGRSRDTWDFGDRRGRFRARLLHRMLFREALRPPPADRTVDATLAGLVEPRNAVTLSRADLHGFGRPFLWLSSKRSFDQNVYCSLPSRRLLFISPSFYRKRELFDG